MSIAKSQHGVISLLPILVITLLVVSVLIAVHKLPLKQDLRSHADTSPGDLMPCPIAPLVAGNVCTDFNVTSQTDRRGMQEMFNNVWDIRVTTRDSHVIPPSVQMDTGCPTGAYEMVSDPNMMTMLCGAHMMSASGDDGVAGWINFLGRTPLDIANRTGTIIFTADAKWSGRQWVTLTFLKDLKRYPGNQAEDTEPVDNGIHFTLRDKYYINLYTNGVERELAKDVVPPPSQNNKRNRFVVRISTTHATLTEDGQTVLDTDINPPLNFTRGYVVLSHGLYNPTKDCNPGDPVHDMDCQACPGNPNIDGGACSVNMPKGYQGVDTIHWDNFGYDAPAQNFAVASTDQGQVINLPGDGSIQKVTLDHPTGGAGQAIFSAFGSPKVQGQMRLNGGTWQNFTSEFWRTIALPITAAKGPNTIEFRSLTGGLFVIHRVDLEVPISSPLPTMTPMPTMSMPPSPSASPCTKVGDFNGDCIVDAKDLSFMLSFYRGNDLKADLNKDGKDTIADFSVFASGYGK